MRATDECGVCRGLFDRHGLAIPRRSDAQDGGLAESIGYRVGTCADLVVHRNHKRPRDGGAQGSCHSEAV